ncbi:MAG: stage III sporulation protein AC [Clostridia bacterium]|nr:stage III sporulation protein AC [Clostridia bacterium]
MDTDIIFKLAGIGILVAIINQLLIKSGRDEQAMLVVIAGLVVAMVMMIDQISMLFNTIKSAFGF